MSGETTWRDPIPPVPEEEPRPRWSVMIPTYNCAGHLRETLLAVLAQAPGPDEMQIEVVDDCSTADDPAAVVAEVGGGRVGFFRQPRNLGHVGNFNTCLRRSRGRLVHLLHGDDLVRPGFYRAMAAVFDGHPEVGAAFCRHTVVDKEGRHLVTSYLERGESGILPGWHEELALGQRLQAPSIAVRRQVYERLGGFDRRIRYYGEDWEMWTRIAAHYPVWYVAEPLASYRMHLSSLSGRSIRTGENVQDLRTAMRLNAALLPPEREPEITRRAAESIALGVISRSRRLFKRGELRTPLVQAREALRTSRSPRVLAGVALLGAQWVWTAAGLPAPARFLPFLRKTRDAR